MLPFISKLPSVDLLYLALLLLPLLVLLFNAQRFRPFILLPHFPLLLHLGPVHHEILERLPQIELHSNLIVVAQIVDNRKKSEIVNQLLLVEPSLGVPERG